MAQYLPAPLEVSVAFYAAEHDGRAWRHLSSQLEVVQVPGWHRGCLTIGAELLVDHLRRRVDALADGAPWSFEPDASTAIRDAGARPGLAGSQFSAG